MTATRNSLKRADTTLGFYPLGWISSKLIRAFHIEGSTRLNGSYSNYKRVPVLNKVHPFVSCIRDCYRLLHVLTCGADGRARGDENSGGAARHFEAAISLIEEHIIYV
eukprot:6203177-Pleurochrysis_carterae.AAC.3